MSEISDRDFDYVRDLVYKESAISVESDMKYLVESRLTTLVRKTKHESVNALLQDLRAENGSGNLLNQVVDAMTTNETSFFRDSQPFETLTKEVLPAIASTHRGPINIWCAACSTGQEAYTIAMSIIENCPDLEKRVCITGTDISDEVLSKAESGRYNRLEVNRGLPVQLLAKFFVQQGLSWEVSPRLKSMVRFEKLNLIKSWGALPEMDVIFLRNVLIYFDPDIKTRILQNTSKVLKPHGCLFLGLSETTLNLQTDYKRVTTDRSHYYKVA